MFCDFRWNFFILYSASSILGKVLLSRFICVGYQDEEHTWIWVVSGILGVNCSQKAHTYWELACFASFIFQKRFFQSNYFVQHVNDIKVSVCDFFIADGPHSKCTCRCTARSEYRAGTEAWARRLRPRKSDRNKILII